MVVPSVPRAISRTDRLVSTGEPALRPAPTSHVRRGTPEGGAPSPDSRLTTSRGVSQDCLTKSKESSDRGAGGIGEGEPWPPAPRKNDSVGFGMSVFSPVCLPAPRCFHFPGPLGHSGMQSHGQGEAVKQVTRPVGVRRHALARRPKHATQVMSRGLGQP